MGCKTHHEKSSLTAVIALAVVGCYQAPQDPPEMKVEIIQAPPDELQQVEPEQSSLKSEDIIEIAKPPSFDDDVDGAETFTHKQTGVALAFPKGWKHDKPTENGFLANVFLHKDNVTADVSWGRTFTDKNSDRTMLAQDAREIRDLYRAQVTGPETVRIGDKIGYRMKVRPPLPG